LPVLHVLLDSKAAAERCDGASRGIANVVLASTTTLWCGRTAAKLFAKKAPSISDQSMLVAYPCTLMYSAFALLTVY